MPSIKKAYFDVPDGQLHYRYLLTDQNPKKVPCVFLNIFGSSYDPETQPPNTAYYVDVFMQLFTSLKIEKSHLVGHHLGAGLANELAALYPSKVLTLCLVRATIMKREEQISLNTLINVPLSEPVAAGAQLQKTWDYLGNHGVGDDLEFKQGELLDHVRAWNGRRQIYACVFEQDMWGFFEKVECETMVMCARGDVL
ncbi:hypothetical protein L207DRAFT_536730 [Hyaloscypha variabilis F]|uniref:Alpha/beta-hydrolase n=1 Tax=Hyaloscypha variabilis (strain UAMH 11265 / GT02V1 / F) TaxID=1149755 RepID=A0A2J6QZS9_HYAVF|nr:hypothetical protein L207DRAFT_536730 [Hyaloscypha variabilis F]